MEKHRGCVCIDSTRVLFSRPFGLSIYKNVWSGRLSCLFRPARISLEWRWSKVVSHQNRLVWYGSFNFRANCLNTSTDRRGNGMGWFFWGFEFSSVWVEIWLLYEHFMYYVSISYFRSVYDKIDFFFLKRTQPNTMFDCVSCGIDGGFHFNFQKWKWIRIEIEDVVLLRPMLFNCSVK